MVLRVMVLLLSLSLPQLPCVVDSQLGWDFSASDAWMSQHFWISVAAFCLQWVCFYHYRIRRSLSKIWSSPCPVVTQAKHLWDPTQDDVSEFWPWFTVQRPPWPAAASQEKHNQSWGCCWQPAMVWRSGQSKAAFTLMVPCSLIQVTRLFRTD